MTKLEHALRLAEQGFYVFRLKKNGKKPFAEGWQEEATTDRDEITRLFSDRDFNIGVYTGKFDVISHNGEYLKTEALAVVDVDTKEGKSGAETMQNLDILGFDFPPTYTVKTASGGLHHVYSYPFALSGGANRIGKNVDLKSHGGYIVGAGSTIDGKEYERIFEGHPIAASDPYYVAQAPEWIRDKAGRPMEKTEAASLISATDTDQALDRAKAYLTINAKPAISGAGGNDTTFKTAASLHDLGISEAAALALMWEHYNPRCTPGWEFDELAVIIGNAYRYAKKAAGINSPHAEFTAIPDDPKDEAAPKERAIFLKWFDEITETHDYPPLLEDMLDQGAMSILYGESNTGKTFVAMDIAFHIATGKLWNNKRTTQGSVLYIAAEGGRAAENRILALQQKYPSQNTPFALVPCNVNLFDSATQLKEIIDLIRAAEQKHPNVRLVVIDTLSRVLAGANENSSEDMTQFIENVDLIRHTTKSHVMIVHHSGKDTSKGARGHSSLRAATDTELEIVDNSILVRKQRDMEFAPPIGFELETITVGTNAYDKPITSCVINLVDYNAREENNSINRLDQRDLIALLALRDCASTSTRKIRQHEAVVDQKDWMDCCKDFDITLVPGSKPWPTSDEGFRKAFRRTRDRLVAFAKVEEVEEKQWALI